MVNFNPSHMLYRKLLTQNVNKKATRDMKAEERLERKGNNVGKGDKRG